MWKAARCRGLGEFGQLTILITLVSLRIYFLRQQEGDLKLARLLGSATMSKTQVHLL